MYRALVAFVVLAAGCASLTETQCRGGPAEWAWLGEYDAVQGDQPWILAYAETCNRYGATVDEEDYLKGWDIGHANFERRVNVGI